PTDQLPTGYCCRMVYSPVRCCCAGCRHVERHCRDIGVLGDHSPNRQVPTFLCLVVHRHDTVYDAVERCRSNLCMHFSTGEYPRGTEATTLLRRCKRRRCLARSASRAWNSSHLCQ
ncbi:unnamed protein product, partial [Ectocarpus sp. 12 AP-2014]